MKTYKCITIDGESFIEESNPFEQRILVGGTLDHEWRPNPKWINFEDNKHRIKWLGEPFEGTKDESEIEVIDQMWFNNDWIDLKTTTRYSNERYRQVALPKTATPKDISGQEDEHDLIKKLNSVKEVHLQYRRDAEARGVESAIRTVKHFLSQSKKPLSEISDEDLIEVAKMAHRTSFLNGKLKWEVGLDTEYGFKTISAKGSHHSFDFDLTDGAVSMYDGDNPSSMTLNHYGVYQYLQHRNYELPVYCPIQTDQKK